VDLDRLLAIQEEVAPRRCCALVSSLEARHRETASTALAVFVNPAAEHGLQSGDVILAVAGKSVSNAADVRNAAEEARSDGRHNVLMRVKTSDNTHFVAVPIG
jgi:membrane-associated protease RseP (regulator of RpoE activity)